MTSPSDRIRFGGVLALGGAVASLVLGAALIGCESEAIQVQTVAPPPPPPSAPPKPKATPIDQLMAELGIDERINLPESKAPQTDPQRRAVLEFFDAFARGDATSLRPMLSRLDQMELEELVASDDWSTAVTDISMIDVQTAEHEGQPVAFAMFHGIHTAGLSFQPQLWYYTATVDDVTFDAIATPPDILDQLSGADWITAWFDLLDEELALADAPDEEFTVPQKNYADGTSTGGGSSPGGFEPGPSRGPGGPGKRPKPKTPRRPPGPPG